MNKAYERINWENYPSENTALNEANLNKMDAALNEVDNRVVAHETTKLDKTTANTMVNDVEFDEATGIFTITFLNGVTKTLDTKLEKIAVNFEYDKANQKLVLTLIDGTVQEIDISALITEYEFENSAYINWTVVNGKVKAEIINGSITADKLQPNFLADVTLQANSAKTSEQNAKTSEENAKQSEINAKNYADSAEPVASTANGLNPTLENSTDAPFISFKGDGKTTQAIEKYFIELTEVSGGVQTNIIDCKSGDEVVLDCGVARTIGYYVYLEDGSSMYEEGSANVQVYTFTAGGKMQFIIKGGTLGDNITITVNGSEYNNPSPDNPVPIHGIGESGVLSVKSTGKNLFDEVNYNKYIYSTTVGADLTTIATDRYGVTDLIDGSKDIVISFIPDKDVIGLIWGITDGKVAYYKTSLITKTESFKGGTYDYWVIGFGKISQSALTTEDLINAECMVEFNTWKTDYEPYTKTTADIPLSSPLYGSDYIKYNMDGSGEESHKMKAVDLGSLIWYLSESYGEPFFYATLSDVKINSRAYCTEYSFYENVKSNIFGDEAPDCSFTISSNAVQLFVKDLSITDVETFKNEVQGAILLYELTEPTVTPLTPEQIAEFDKLRSFDGVTHVTCEAESEIQYFYDSVSGKAVAMIANMLKK